MAIELLKDVECRNATSEGKAEKLRKKQAAANSFQAVAREGTASKSILG
jgi:hypothetical protein